MLASFLTNAEECEPISYIYIFFFYILILYRMIRLNTLTECFLYY
jgi:hypothetical protein